MPKIVPGTIEATLDSSESEALRFSSQFHDEIERSLTSPRTTTEFEMLMEALSPKEMSWLNEPVPNIAMQEYSPAVCLVSGGIDSTILYRRMLRMFRNVRAVFVNFGQDGYYAERAVLKALHIPYIEVNCTDLNYDKRASGWGHILPARNLVALEAAATYGDVGSVIGIGATSGEIPESGGDKSRTFLKLATAYLKRRAGIYGIMTLGGQTKVQWIKTALAEKWVTEVDLLRTITCYTPTVYDSEGSVGGPIKIRYQHCGKCQACLNRFIALRLGLGDDYRRTIELNFAKQPLIAAIQAVDKYKRVMREELNGIHDHGYGLDRIRETLSIIDPDALFKRGINRAFD